MEQVNKKSQRNNLASSMVKYKKADSASYLECIQNAPCWFFFVKEKEEEHVLEGSASTKLTDFSQLFQTPFGHSYCLSERSGCLQSFDRRKISKEQNNYYGKTT